MSLVACKHRQHHRQCTVVAYLLLLLLLTLLLMMLPIYASALTSQRVYRPVPVVPYRHIRLMPRKLRQTECNYAQYVRYKYVLYLVWMYSG